MTVLHISGSTVWGGNEQQLVSLIPEQEALGIKNIVLLKKDSFLEKECKNRNISYIQAKKTKKNKFTVYKYFRNLIQELKPDIIHFHTSDFLTVYVITDKLYNLKTPTVYIRKSMINSKSFVGRLRYNYKNLSALVCVSENVKNNMALQLSKKNQHKLYVIHDCIPISILDESSDEDLRVTYAIPRNAVLIGNIANHTRAKDLETFIDTADYLINQLNTKNVFFVQIGEFTKLTEGLKNKIKEKNLENYFVLTDKMDKAYKFNHQFDIFLMTSEREGGPTALLEAMYVEKPIVSTNVGIVPEIIRNGENGYISDVKDYISLAKNIQTLVIDSEKRKSIVKGNKDLIIKNNSSQVTAQKTLQLYKNIVK